jgi:hypothetical protein
MTDHAKKLLNKELDKLATSDDQKIALLEQSILNNWKGVFPIKENNKPMSIKERQELTPSRVGIDI